jgi:hypothetical protein
MYLEVRLSLGLSKEWWKRFYAAASEVQHMRQADHKQQSLIAIQ